MKKYSKWILILSFISMVFIMIYKLITDKPSNVIAISFVVICAILILVSFYLNEKGEK